MVLVALAAPVGAIVAWAVLLRFRGVPGGRFFLAGAAVVPLLLLAGETAGEVEDRGRPYGCRTGTTAGPECGYGLDRLAGIVGAVLVAVVLVILALASAVIAWWRRNRDSAQPEVAADDHGHEHQHPDQADPVDAAAAVRPHQRSRPRT
jgi:hypothetical protein